MDDLSAFYEETQSVPEYTPEEQPAPENQGSASNQLEAFYEETGGGYTPEQTPEIEAFYEETGGGYTPPQPIEQAPEIKAFYEETGGGAYEDNSWQADIPQYQPGNYQDTSVIEFLSMAAQSIQDNPVQLDYLEGLRDAVTLGDKTALSDAQNLKYAFDTGKLAEFKPYYIPETPIERLKARNEGIENIYQLKALDFSQKAVELGLMTDPEIVDKIKAGDKEAIQSALSFRYAYNTSQLENYKPGQVEYTPEGTQYFGKGGSLRFNFEVPLLGNTVADMFNRGAEELFNTLDYGNRAFREDIPVLLGQKAPQKDPATGFEGPSGFGILPQLLGDTIGNYATMAPRVLALPVLEAGSDGVGKPVTGFLGGIAMMAQGGADALVHGVNLENQMMAATGWKMMNDPTNGFEWLRAGLENSPIKDSFKEWGSNAPVIGGVKNFLSLFAGDSDDGYALPVVGGIFNFATSGELFNPVNLVGFGLPGRVRMAAGPVGQLASKIPYLDEVANAARSIPAVGRAMEATGLGLDKTLAVLQMADSGIARGLGLPVEALIKISGGLLSKTPILQLTREAAFVKGLENFKIIMDDVLRNNDWHDIVRIANGEAIQDVLPGISDDAAKELGRYVSGVKDLWATDPAASGTFPKSLEVFNDRVIRGIADEVGYKINAKANGLQKSLEFVQSSVKEAWLTFNPAYYAQNFIDNTVKAILYGTGPMGDGAAKAYLDGWGIGQRLELEGYRSLTNSIFGTDVESKYIRGRTPGLIRSLPGIGDLARWTSEKFGANLERAAHNGAIVSGMKRFMRSNYEAGVIKNVDQYFDQYMPNWQIDPLAQAANARIKSILTDYKDKGIAADKLKSILLGEDSSIAFGKGFGDDLEAVWNPEITRFLARLAETAERLGGYNRVTGAEFKNIVKPIVDEVKNVAKIRTGMQQANNYYDQKLLNEFDAEMMGQLWYSASKVDSVAQAFDLMYLLRETINTFKSEGEKIGSEVIDLWSKRKANSLTDQEFFDQKAAAWARRHFAVNDTAQSALGAAEMLTNARYTKIELESLQKGLQGEFVNMAKEYKASEAATRKTVGELFKLWKNDPVEYADFLVANGYMPAGPATTGAIPGATFIRHSSPAGVPEPHDVVPMIWNRHYENLLEVMDDGAANIIKAIDDLLGPGWQDLVTKELYANRLVPQGLPDIAPSATGPAQPHEFWTRWLVNGREKGATYRAQNMANITDSADRLIKAMYAYEKELGRRAATRSGPEIPGGIGLLPNRQAQQRIVDSIIKDHNTMVDKAWNEGKNFSTNIFFNYAATTNLDAFLGMFAPFTVWQTRNIPLYALTLSQRPAVLRLLNEVEKQSIEDSSEEGVPTRMRGQLRLQPLDSVYSALTGQNIKAYAQPFAMLFGGYQQFERQPFVNKDANPAYAAFANLAYAAGGISLWPYIDLPLKMAGAQGRRVYLGSQLAPSRAIQGITGEDPEAFWKAWFYDRMGFESNTGNPLTDVAIRSRISQIGFERKLSNVDLYKAMEDPKSDLWKEAAKQVARMEGATTLARYVFPLGVKIVTPAEEEFNKAGKKDFLGALKNVPGYAPFTNKNASLVKLEIESSLAEYYAIGTPEQRKINSIYGPMTPQQRTEFIRTRPQDYAEVKKMWDAQNAWRENPENAAALAYFEASNAAKASGGKLSVSDWLINIPQPARWWEVDKNSPDFKAGAAMLQKRAGDVQFDYTYNQGRRRDVTTVQNAYYAILDPVREKYDQYRAIEDPAQRARFLDRNPELRAAFREQSKYLDENPIAGKYITWSQQQSRAGTSAEDRQIEDYLRALDAGKVAEFIPRKETPVGRLQLLKEEYDNIGSSINPEVNARLAEFGSNNQARNAYIRANPDAKRIVDAEAAFKKEYPIYDQYSKWLGQQINSGKETSMQAFIQSLGKDADKKVPLMGERPVLAASPISNGQQPASQSGTRTTATNSTSQLPRNSGNSAPVQGAGNGLGVGRTTNSTLNQATVTTAPQTATGTYPAAQVSTALIGQLSNAYNQIQASNPQLYKAYIEAAPEERSALIKANPDLKRILDEKQQFLDNNPEYGRYNLWAGERAKQGLSATIREYVVELAAGRVAPYLTPEEVAGRNQIRSLQDQYAQIAESINGSLWQRYNSITDPEFKKKYGETFADELAPIFKAQSEFKRQNPDLYRYLIWAGEQRENGLPADADDFIRSLANGSLPEYLSDRAMMLRVALEDSADDYKAILTPQERYIFEAYQAQQDDEARRGFVRGSPVLRGVLEKQRKYKEADELYTTYAAWASSQSRQGSDDLGMGDFIKALYQRPDTIARVTTILPQQAEQMAENRRTVNVGRQSGGRVRSGINVKPKTASRPMPNNLRPK